MRGGRRIARYIKEDIQEINNILSKIHTAVDTDKDTRKVKGYIKNGIKVCEKYIKEG